MIHLFYSNYITAFEDIQIKAKKDHTEKLLRQEQLEKLKIEEAQREVERVERERLEQEQLQVAKQKNMEVEIRYNEHRKFQEEYSSQNEIRLPNSLGKEDKCFVESLPKLEGDGRKRGAKDLDNEDERDEYPKKSLKCHNDEIEFESFACDATTDLMELDDSQQEWFKASYKQSLQSYDVKNVAISRFLEAISKQQQMKIKNESVSHDVEEMNKINGQTHLQDLISIDEIPSKSPIIDETTPMNMNMNMIQIEDIGEQIITNTLITTHDQCQSNEQGISSLLHDDDQVKGWNFQRGLQDRLLLKEVINVEKRDAEVAEVNGTNHESNGQSTRPVIWGTCKYRDLWAKAVTIDDDIHMNNASPIPKDQVMDDGFDNVNLS